MYKNVLLAVDLGEDASWKRALPEAIALIKASGGVLHIMTVVPDFGMTVVGSFFPSGFESKAIASAQEKLHAFVKEHVPQDIKVQHIIAHGGPAEEILAAAKKVPTDVIVWFPTQNVLFWSCAEARARSDHSGRSMDLKITARGFQKGRWVGKIDAWNIQQRVIGIG